MELPKLPSIPATSSVSDPTIASILRPLREAVILLGNAISGTPNANKEVITTGFSPYIASSGGSTFGVTGYNPTTDYTPPAIPTGFSAAGAFQNIILTWTPPTYPNHAYTEIWRANSNALGAAELLGTSYGSVYVDAVGTYQNYWYWIRFVSKAAVEGPYDGASGTSAQTALDPTYIMSVLANSGLTSPGYPFYVQSSSTTINGVSVPAGVYMSTAYIANGSIANAQIGNAVIDDAKIVNLNGSKINANSITATQIAASSVTADKLNGGQITATSAITIGGSGSNAPLVLTADGQIVSNDGAGNYTRMFSANFEVWKYISSLGHTVKYNALSRAEFGVATNNTVVTIPGYWTSQPNVIASPASMQLYSASYAGQNQSIQCYVNNLVQTFSGSQVWQFTPVAQLSLAANTGNTVVNENSGTTSSDSWVTGTYTTAANTTDITPSVYVSTYCGQGTSGVYYVRQFVWVAQYYNGSTWVNMGSSVTVTCPATQPANITSTQLFSFPSSGTWQFRIVGTTSNVTGSTFNTGTSYITATDTATNAGGTVSATSYTNYPSGAGTPQTNSANYTPSYSVPGGWTIVSIAYAYNYSYSVSYTASSGGSASVSAPGLSIGSNGSGSSSVNATGYTTNSFVATAHAASDYLHGASASLTIGTITATIVRHQPATNSTTPVNVFNFNSYAYDLSSATVLATGSLNWIAIGN